MTTISKGNKQFMSRYKYIYLKNPHNTQRIERIMCTKSISVVIILVISVAIGDVPQCNRQIPLIHNFDPSKIVGTWNVQFTGSEQKSKKSCMVATITAQENQLILDEAGFVNGELDHCVVTLTQIKSTSEYVGESKEFPPSNVWIVGTDYSSYSVFFLCKNGHKQDGVIFFCTRDKNPGVEVLENARNAITKAGLTIGDDYLYPVDDSNC